MRAPTFDALPWSPPMSPSLPSSLSRLSDFVPEPVAWLWPSVFAPGKLTLIDGDPSQGQSLLTLDLAARLTTARAFPDGHGIFASRSPPG
jgi:hypothetical protein